MLLIKDKMINKTEILRNYHDQAIVISLANVNEALSGMIVDDSPNDHCVFVRDQDLLEYYETKKKSLSKRVYFKDLKTIDYQ
jgi:hypothetical protein